MRTTVARGERINTRAGARAAAYRGRINHREIMHMTSAARVGSVRVPDYSALASPPPPRALIRRPNSSKTARGRRADSSMRGRSNEHVTPVCRRQPYTGERDARPSPVCTESNLPRISGYSRTDRRRALDYKFRGKVYAPNATRFKCTRRESFIPTHGPVPGLHTVEPCQVRENWRR